MKSPTELASSRLAVALVADIDDKGPAKDIIEPGDVIVQFDGKDIKEMRDLPRVVADTPVGKDVAVVIIRKGARDYAARHPWQRVTYERGRIVVHDGYVLHAIGPASDPAPLGYRITLQGHGVRTSIGWMLYW
jgi:hypothetical protein